MVIPLLPKDASESVVANESHHMSVDDRPEMILIDSNDCLGFVFNQQPGTQCPTEECRCLFITITVAYVSVTD